jgi:hypothetical protein
MTIIATTDLSNYRSNSGKNKSVTFAEQFGMYMIIVIECKEGFFGYKNANIVGTYTDYRRAVDCYIKNGGVMRREF